MDGLDKGDGWMDYLGDKLYRRMGDVRIGYMSGWLDEVKRYH